MIEHSITEKIWAVVPAAGSGSRMAADRPKQYLSVKGKTIIQHTLDRLFELPLSGLVVCISPQDKDWEKLNFSHEKLLSVIHGGETRAHSVLNGLLFLSEKADNEDWVMVHDAARPAVSEQALKRLIDELQQHETGGLLAVPVNDTVKLANALQAVEKTLDRSQLWYAQTPQMYRFGVLKQALEQAIEQNLPITDESSAIELMGLESKLVMGDASNIKVTTPADMALIETLLEK